MIYTRVEGGQVGSGNYLKDYDDYQKKIPRTDEVIEKFFKPD